MGELIVLRAGMLTTVQDGGRWGHQHAGVPVAGPMDWYSHRLANRWLGNDDGAAALEITLLGPELEVTSGSVSCVVTGAVFEVTVNGEAVEASKPFDVRARDRIRFGTRRSGARSYLAVAGGFDLPATLGSRATSLSSRLGPFGGRALRTGDALPIAREQKGALVPGRPLPLPDGGARVRVIVGPHEARFTPSGREALTTGRYHVTPESNRMGYRLDGPAIGHAVTADILSDATPMGSLQVPPSGQPILLMADRQTTGGYARIATVITADLPLAGQLAPGDWIEFVPCTLDDAASALRGRLDDLGANR